MQTIDLTDFWINRPYIGSSNNFTILSDTWYSLNNCTIGNGKAYYYNGLVDKQQLKCIVIDDTFYFDFSANPITDVIKQQMWILKHTKNIDYKIEFVCLWEMFKLPTIEELNEFAKIKQEVVVPEQSTVDQYIDSVEEMRLSTGLPEELQIRQIALPLSEYLDLMLRMTHTRLNTDAVIRHATIIHNYHNPVVQAVPVVEDLTASVLPSMDYENARHSLTDFSALTLSDLAPEPDQSLADYIESLESEVELPYEDILHYGTIIYNHHNGS